MGIIADLLANRPAKPYKWGDDVGQSVAGEALAVRIDQSKDFHTEEPEFWPNGEPKMVIITIQTDLDEGVDEEGREDDGRRDLYMRGGGHTALVKALTEAKITDDHEVVGMLTTMTLIGRKKSSVKKGTDRKLYSVEFTATSV